MLCRQAGVPAADVRGNIASHRARSTIASQLYNAKEPMTLFELQEWLGHRSPDAALHYARITPNTLARAYRDTGYFARNLRTIEVLLDRDSITSGAAATGTPWQYYDLGPRLLHLLVLRAMPAPHGLRTVRLLRPQGLRQGAAARGQGQPAAHARLRSADRRRTRRGRRWPGSRTSCLPGSPTCPPRQGPHRTRSAYPERDPAAHRRRPARAKPITVTIQIPQKALADRLRVFRRLAGRRYLNPAARRAARPGHDGCRAQRRAHRRDHRLPVRARGGHGSEGEPGAGTTSRKPAAHRRRRDGPGPGRVITAASVQDRDGAWPLLWNLTGGRRRLRRSRRPRMRRNRVF